MKIRVADYIAEYLVKSGITDVFTVVGGGAMFLNDAFGHKAGLHCTYNHHEQACAIAAESYARIHNKLAVVCVTSGPGAINALNGVAGAYMDSIPMLVISGQTKTALTIKHSGLKLRTLGNQEFDIISAVSGMTKYCEMLEDAESIKYCLDKAVKLATAGRPGPCWLDVPLDIQGAFIEMEEAIEHPFSLEEEAPASIDWQLIEEKIRLSHRPIFYAGNAIRISGGYDVFRTLVEKLQIPTVTGWNSIDLLPTEHPLYAGRAGIMGDRSGNFAVQNSDFIISLGSRLSVYQVGYDIKTWAREAYVIAVDIDGEELKKPTIRVDMPIRQDVKAFMEEMLMEIKDAAPKSPWILQCQNWKLKYPVVQKKHYINQELCNVYAFINEISSALPENAITVVANGSASVVGSQAYRIKEGQRFIMNCALSSMGYDLPASIGACIANDRNPIICIAGDGSIQMNLQELQTIITNKLPIKIYIINNQGYHQIRLTQKNIFNGTPLIGIGPESGDLGFPSMEKLAWAYGYPYFSCKKNAELSDFVRKTLAEDGPFIAEVFTDTNQIYEPKSASKRLADGTIISPPLEDLAPFLSREELKENMYISTIT